MFLCIRYMYMNKHMYWYASAQKYNHIYRNLLIQSKWWIILYYEDKMLTFCVSVPQIMNKPSGCACLFWKWWSSHKGCVIHINKSYRVEIQHKASEKLFFANGKRMTELTIHMMWQIFPLENLMSQWLFIYKWKHTTCYVLCFCPITKASLL